LDICFTLSPIGMTVSDKSNVRFRVKACNDVIVGLGTSSDTNPNTYQIVVGGWANTKSVIR